MKFIQQFSFTLILIVAGPLSNIFYLLAFAISFAKDDSHAYIFITLIPLIISFIRLILSSVFFAVFPRNL